MSKKIILLFCLFYSCERLPSSIGDINTIAIICSNKDKEESEHIVKHFFESRSIKTPQNEMVYSLKWFSPKEINKAKLMKNILLLSLVYPRDSTIDVLVNRVRAKNEITDNISSLENMFANNQRVVMIKSTNTIELEAQFLDNFQWIISEYNQNIYSNYYHYIKGKGQNLNLESLLNNQFNISMFIQEDYKLIYNSDNFLWLGRGYPYRWIIFYKINRKMIDREFNPYMLFEEILEDYNTGINIYDGYKKKTSLVYNKKLSYVYRGIYEHSDSQTGGPFALYLLDNINNDEVILVASIINNPGKKKVPHLLQIDALVNNIKFLGE